MTTLVEIVILGSFLIGSASLLSYFYKTVREVEGVDVIPRLLFMVVWVLSLGNRAMGRLCLIAGCAIAIHNLYSVIVIYARILSQRLGDKILEPNTH
jgi:hypothetical protein